MTLQKIGRFEIIRELGRGGMAVVYLAYDPNMKRQVAIKVLPFQLTSDPHFRTRFKREAEIVAQLEHPHIVPVYDFGEENEQPYIVMRYMTGGTMADRLAKGPLSVDEVARIISALASALDSAHAKGIIHRDLKSGNILFDGNDQPYVADFGIAKIAGVGTSASLTGSAVIGTPGYMSPEQVRGDKDIDGRSDIYALGVMLFEALTGKLPFEADTPMGMAVKHLTEPVPSAVEAKPDLPMDCDTIISRAMAKERDERFATAGKLGKELNRLASGAALTPGGSATQVGGGARLSAEAAGRRPLSTPIPKAPPASRTVVPATQYKKRGQGGMVWGLLFALLVLIALGVGAVFFLPSLFNPPTPTQAVAAAIQTSLPPTSTVTPSATASETSTPLPPMETLTPQPSTTSSPTPLPTATPTLEEVIVSLTPTLPLAPALPVAGGADKLAFVKDNDIWIANMDATHVDRLTTTGGSKSNLQWSPDGQSVIYIAGRCAQAVDIDTRLVSTILCVNWAEYLSGFFISPDGSQVAISLSDGLFILPYDIPTLSAIKRQDQLQAAQGCLRYTDNQTKTVRWSRDGASLAVVIIGTELGRQVELIKVMDVSRCGQDPVRMDEFPGTRFTPTGYSSSPEIQSFGWDGDVVFAMNIDRLNDFGDMYLYNMSSKSAQMLNPIGNNQCCYRDFIWSPDGNYVLFAFQDNRYAKSTLLYFVPFGTLGTGETYTPMPFDENFFINPREKPQPALRPEK